MKKEADNWINPQKALDTVDIPICLISPKGKVIQCNSAMKTFASENLSTKIVDGHSYTEILGKDVLGKNCVLQKSKKTLDQSVGSYRVNGKTIRVGAEPIVNRRGGITGFLYVMREMSDFNSRLKHNGYSVWTFDSKGCVNFPQTESEKSITALLNKPDGKNWSLKSIKNQQGLIETSSGFRFITTIRGYPDEKSYTRLEYDASDIMDQKEMSYKELKKFKAVFDDSPTLNIVISTDGKIELVNKAFTDCIGYKKSEMIGKDAIDFVHPDMREAVSKSLENDFNGKKNDQMKVRVPTKSGKERIIQFPQSYATLIYSSGEPTSMILSGLDITETSKTSDRLEETMRVLETLVESLPDAVYLKDRKKRFLKVNREFERVFNVTRENVIGKTDRQVFDDSVRKANRQAESQCVEKGFPVKSVMLHDSKHFATLRSPIYDRSGEFDGLIGVSRDVTEDVMMNKEVESSEKNYREMFDAAHDGMILLRKDGMISDANASALDMLGLNKGQVIKATVQDICSDKVMSSKIKLALDGQGQLFESRMHHNDGRSFWTEVSLRRVMVDGSYRCLAAIRDIDTRKKTEKEIKESKEKYKTIFDNSPDMIMLLSEDGEVKAVNPVVQTWLGYDPDTINGLKFRNLPFLTSKAKSSISKSFKERMQGADITPYVVQFKTKSGSLEHAKIHGNPLVDKHGKIFADLVFISNVTQQIEYESNLIQSEEKFRLAFQNSQDSILWFDAKSGVVINCNDMAEDLLGYPKTELIGMRFIDIIPSEKTAEHGKAFSNLVKDGKSNIVRSEVMTRSGENKNVSVSASMTEFENRKIVQGVFKDITSQLAAEKSASENRQLIDRLMNNFPGMAYKCQNDDNWTMIIISEGSKDLTGYSPNELKNNNTISYDKIIHPEDRMMVADSINQAIKSDNRFKITYRIKPKEGPVKWVFEQGVVIDKQTIEGFIFDITDRMDAEKEIKERNFELENFNKFAIGREIKMIQLKKRISSLETRLRRYESD